MLMLITLIGTAYALWTFYGAGEEATLWGLLLLMTGIPVWLWMRFNSLLSSQRAEAVPAGPLE